MIEIPFDPELHLGTLRISWHGLWSLAGMAAAVAVGARLARGIATFDQVYGIAFTGIVGGLVGSRVVHVLDLWPVYASDPLQVVAVWNGGASIAGGMIGGTLAGVWRARRYPIDAGRFLDVGAVGLAVGMLVGRVGDIISGEHHAAACEGLPWCVRYTHPATLGQSDPVHPAIAYEMVWDLVAIAVLLWLFPRAPRLGLARRMLPLFFGIYGAGRFAISFLRLDPPWLLGLQQAQVLSLAFVAVATLALATRARGAQLS